MISFCRYAKLRSVAVAISLAAALSVSAVAEAFDTASPQGSDKHRIRVASIGLPPSGFASTGTATLPLKGFAALRLADSSARYRDSSLYANCSASRDAVLLEPLCGFYYQLLDSFYDSNSNLLALEDQLWNWRLERRRVEFSQLEIMDLLALDLTRVSLYSIHDSRMRDIGIPLDMLRTTPTLHQLKASFEQVLVSVSENIEELPQAMAIAVWGDAEQPLAVLVRSAPLMDSRPIATRR